MSEPALSLLLVDDEDSVREPLAQHLSAQPYNYMVKSVANVEEAMQILEETKGRFAVALIDEVLKEGSSGLDLLRHIKTQYSQIECILFTGWGMQSGLEALRAGAYRYFAKPFNLEELALTIRFAAEEKRIRKEYDYMEALVKASQALTQTMYLDEQLKIIWNFVREQLETPTCFVSLYNPETDILSFPLSYDEGELDPLPNLPLGAEQSNWGLAGFVVKTGQEQVWFTRAKAEKDWQVLGIKSRFSPKGPSESGICLPLKTTDEVVGALSVQSYEPYAFDQALLNAVRALGNQVAVTLENSRLVSETKQKALNLEKLQSLTIAINSTLDLKQVLIQTCQAAVELAGVDHSGLVVFEPDLSRGMVVAEYPEDEQASGRIIPVWGVTAEEQLVHQQQILNIPDVANDTALGSVREILLNFGIRSILIVPVIFDGQVVASFSLDAIQDRRVFSQSEIEICQSLANQAAVAIRNARLYQETHQGREYLQSFYQATTEIISAHDPNDVLHNIVATACRATGAWQAVALLVDESYRPRVLASFGFDRPLDLTENIRSDGISIQVVRSGKARFISNIEAESDEVNPAMLEAGTKAAACLPLMVLGKNFGVLWIQFRQERSFSETEKQALQLYANQSAVAYGNSRLIQELVQLRESAEAMASAEEPKEALQRIVEGAKQVLGADATLIWSYDSHREHGVFIPDELVAQGISQEQLEAFRNEEPKAGRTTRYVLERGYVKVTDISTADEIGKPTRVLLEDLGIKSFHSIRLDVAGEPLGVLHVDYKNLRDFGEEERRILEHFANQAALTLKKARLLRQVERAHEAAAAVSAATIIGKLEDTLREIVRGAKEVLGCDIVTLYTFDEKAQRFMHVEGTGYNLRSNMRHPQDVTRSSSLWRVVELAEPYYHFAEKASEDSLLEGGFVRAEKIRAVLGIQLRFGRERVGVMFINYRGTHRFTQDEIDDALQFGNQAAVAIRNAQLHERIMRQAETLEVLYKASKAVGSLLDLKEILDGIAEQAWHLVGRSASYTSISLVENEIAKVVATYPSEQLAQTRATVPQINLKIGVNGRFGVTGRAIKTGKSQIVDDVSGDKDYLGSHPQTRSEMAVPIILGEATIGVINVESPRLQAFSEEDERALLSLASYSAIAINDTQLHERTKKHAETLGGLYEAGKAITSTLSLNETLQSIAEQSLRVIGPSCEDMKCFSHIALVEGNSNLPFVAAYPPEMFVLLQKGFAINLHTNSKIGIAGRAIKTRKLQNIEDVERDPDYIPASTYTKSQLSVPLKMGEDIIGVLSIEHPVPNAFSTEDEMNIQLLAAQAAVAIRNARRFGEAESILAARTALAWTGMISSTWRHAIEKHAITIREQIELMRDDLARLPKGHAIEKRLDMMERLANQILKKPLTAPLSAEEVVEPVYVNDFIKERTSQLWAHQPYKEINLESHLELENSCTVRASIEWLRRAFDILIDNAVDATVGLPERKIILSSRRADYRAEVLIRDNGHGIPPDLQERLFREQIAKDAEAKGLGMGLLFAQMIVQTYRGEIRIGETGATGTTMVISFPLEA